MGGTWSNTGTLLSRAAENALRFILALIPISIALRYLV
jgi:hypothetical protein